MNNNQLSEVIKNLDAITDLTVLRDAITELNWRCNYHRKNILFQTRDVIPALRRKLKGRTRSHDFLQCEKTDHKDNQ